jgi:PleD family two-component response regulator
VSIGVAFASPGEPVDDVIADADRAMYRAKQTGRDRVVVL